MWFNDDDNGWTTYTATTVTYTTLSSTDDISQPKATYKKAPPRPEFDKIALDEIINF